MPSFDMVSEVESTEIRNAAENAERELATRFDFRGVKASIELKDDVISVSAESDFQCRQMLDIVSNNIVKRKIDPNSIDADEDCTHTGKTYSLAIRFQQGIDQPTAKKIVKLIKGAKTKVQAVLSQIFLICVTLLFLATNGHLVMIEVFLESFRVWPISASIFNDGGFTPEIIWLMIHRVSWMFASALLLALPVITSVLVINISFGIMSRASPQMNVFALGFPISQLFGMLIIWIGFVGFLPQYHRFAGDTFAFLRNLLGV